MWCVYTYQKQICRALYIIVYNSPHFLPVHYRPNGFNIVCLHKNFTDLPKRCEKRVWGASLEEECKTRAFVYERANKHPRRISRNPTGIVNILTNWHGDESSERRNNRNSSQL